MFETVHNLWVGPNAVILSVPKFRIWLPYVRGARFSRTFYIICQSISTAPHYLVLWQ
jgi:hypothetical protein